MLSINEQWVAMCRDIVEHGVDVFPRGEPIRVTLLSVDYRHGSTNTKYKRKKPWL